MEHRGDVEHVGRLDAEVELLDDRLGEQLDERRRVGQRGDRDAPDEVRRQPRHHPQVLAHQAGDGGRCTLTTTSSPVRSVAACTWAIEAAASGVRSNEAKTSSSAAPRSASTTARTVVERLGRHLVAAQLELADQLLGEQPLAAGDDLAELDVGRAELLGGEAQPAGDVGPAGLRRGEACRGAAPPPRPERAAQRARPRRRRGCPAGPSVALVSSGTSARRRGAQLGRQRQPADAVAFQRPRTVVAERSPVGVGRASHPGMIAGASADRNSPGSAIRAGPAGTLG